MSLYGLFGGVRSGVSRFAGSRSEVGGGSFIKKGVTLVELLVVVAIMTIVTGAALVVFKSTASSEARQQLNIEQTQNLRAAFYTVARDVRMAGNGMGLLGVQAVQIYVDPALHDSDYADGAGWFRYAGVDDYGVFPVFGTDSGADKNKSDSLTVFRTGLEDISDIGSLENTYTPGSSTSITLSQRITEGVEISDGDIIGISDGVVAVIAQASLNKGQKTNTIKLGSRFYPAASLPSGLPTSTFSPGSVVVNFRDATFVTYYVDMEKARLMANYHDSSIKDDDSDVANPHLVVVANNIEDFQVNYCMFPPILGSDPVFVTGITRAALDTQYVGAVRIGMVSRSSAVEESAGGGNTIELMGHETANKPGYTRRIITEIVQLRNS
ncbi:PilW family protein [Deltaproteobacteria bacterium OttesenSCG-928-K17]|nr:PilW family protein [Deltaproteobacteria bacterium OttesenSCG-928-K17]